MDKHQKTGFLREAKTLIDLDTFSFKLITSFRSRNEAIGLELIEHLTVLCSKYGYDKLFIHESRFSSEKKVAKWNQAYFEAAFKEMSAATKKVWVCGPPDLHLQAELAVESAKPSFPVDF